MAKATQADATFRMLKVLTTEIDRDLPITSALVFARVAMAPEGIDQKELMDELELGSSSMSRTVQTLADIHYLKDKPGLGLLSRAMDLKDNKKRVLRLTAKGERLLKKLAEAA